MNKGKIFALAGMLVLGAAVFGVVNWHVSRAQTASSIKPLKIASIASVTSSNPRGNYVRADGTLYCDASKICNDNSGISVFTGNFPTPYTECGHMGLKGASGEFLYDSTDPARVVWENRTACNGYIAIGTSDRVQEQVLTINGTTQDAKTFTLNVNVPQVLGNSLGNWRFYVDTNGATYYCRADHTTSPLRYPNDCDLTVDQAFQSQHLARAGNPAVANDGLCQAEESYATTPQDCPDTAPPIISAISATTGYGSTTVSWVTDEPSDSIVDHGSSASAYSYTNSGGVSTINHTVQLNVSMSYGVTYYYRVKSKDAAGNQATSDQQSLTVAAPPPPPPSTGDLVGHWKFDGNGNNEVTGGPAALIVGNASFKSTGGKLDGYAYVPGSSDWVKILYNSIFDLADSFTIEFWFRQRFNQSFNQNLVYKGTPPNNYNFNISRWLWNEYNQGPVIAGHTAANTGYWTQPSNPNQLAHNEWHHVVFTKSPSYHAYYLDGALIGSKDVTQSWYSEYSGPAKTPHNDIIIGDTAVDTDFDNLKIYNRALSADEARQNGGFPASTMPATPSGLVATIASNGTDVNLSWMDNSNNESGFRVYRRKVGGSPEAELRGSTGPGITSYTDINIPAGTYEYYVTSYIMSGGQLSQQSPTSNVPVVTTSGTTTPTGTSTQPVPPPPPPPGPGGDTPRGCKIGEASCPKASWCEGGGMQCYFPDAKITCVGSTTTATGLITARCPASTSVCEPYDPARSWTANCVVPGQKIKYVPSVSSKWCGGGTSAYYSQTKNTDGSYDMICLYSEELVPIGYGACRPEDKNCREKGDRWTAEEEKTLQYIYCAYGQKCNLSGGGGTCVGQNELCPSGTLYCPQNTGSAASYSLSKCGEPDTCTELSAEAGQSFWCGGGGVAGYVGNKACCSQRKLTGPPDYGMLSGPEIKAFLAKIGTNGKLCNPFSNSNTSGLTYSSKCLEPGQRGSSNDWCAWNPPGSYAATPMTGTTRTCPSLDDVVITPPPPPPGTTTPPVEPPKPPEYRECRPGEFPNSINMCMLPSYRWSIAEKKWEKCTLPTRTDSMIMNPKATHTNCQPMHFEIEEKWRTMRYLTRPPEKYGEWYMPPWDAAADMKQYNPQGDGFENCRVETIAVRPEEWTTSCTPVPKEDAEWLLEMNRAQYKIWQLSHLEDMPVPPIPEPPAPDIPPAACKMHIRNIRAGLSGDKQFWKDMKRQISVLPKDHPDFEKLTSLLNESKNLIQAAEKRVRLENCSKEALAELRDITDKLHTEIFAELSSYLSSIHDYVEVGFCQSNLTEKVKRLNELAKKASDEESREELEEFASDIEEKLAEFKEKAGDFEYDAAFECREYIREVEFEFSSLIRQNDHNIRRVVEDILEKELGPVLEQLEARKERIDQLLVQVAELRKAADSVADAITGVQKSADEIANKVATSLKVLAYLGDKFEKHKQEIEEAKGKLVPLVQRAIEMLGENRCLRAAMQTRVMTAFQTMTSVNWIDKQHEELGRRLNAFIAACEARDVASEDTEIFIRDIHEAAERNQRASCERGLTPFCDVPTHEWYYGGMFTGHRTGFITQGRPGDNVLRQDALLMILRVKGLTDKELKGECEIPRTSSVINASPYARCAVARALEKGLIVRGDVSVPVSRAEIASWIAALELVPDMSDERVKEIQSSYQDLKRGVLPEWVSAIARLVEAKVMIGQVGSEVSIWQPFENLTRASLAVVLEQLQKLKGNLPT